MKFIQKIKYDTTIFNFQEIIFEHFKKKNPDIKKDSSDIHEKIHFTNNSLHDVSKIKTPIHDLRMNYFDVKLDQKNKFVIYFYKIDNAFSQSLSQKKVDKFYKTYLDLLNHLQKTYFKEKIIVQSKPTLRAHIPENISVGSYHRDSDYGHPKEEINMWLPFNKSVNTSTLWLESAPDKSDFKPYNLDYGEILIFNSMLHHGTEVNKEDHSRLSMDFRVIKKTSFKNNTLLSSPKNNIKFNLGGYFREL